MKAEKGITLVALIITIIVMLILVAVTVSAVVKSDLINQAEQAGNAYENADDNLTNIGSRDIIQDASRSSVNAYLNAALTPGNN